jgi:hypothetical protein
MIGKAVHKNPRMMFLMVVAMPVVCSMVEALEPKHAKLPKKVISWRKRKLKMKRR